MQFAESSQVVCNAKRRKEEGKTVFAKAEARSTHFMKCFMVKL